jgi:SAM-dependent methyltransferase
VTYNPRAYWAERFQVEGPTYVGSSRDGSNAQADAFAAILKPSLEAWAERSTGLILDYGCGVGRMYPYFWPLLDLGNEYVGADINRPAVEHARSVNPSGRFEVVGDSGKIPLRTGSVDLIVAATVLQHVPEALIEATCAELRRVLAVGGTVLLIEDANPEKLKPAPHMSFREPHRYAEMMGMRMSDLCTFTAERRLSHFLIELRG